MQRSTERILTTHAGSLPRPDDLRDLLIAKDDGQPYDQARFATRVRSAVCEVVQQQIAAGLDIINDGELSKRSFSTYARERLSGFEERPLSADERPSMISGRDMPEFSEYFASRGGFGGASANARQVFCISLRDIVDLILKVNVEGYSVEGIPLKPRTLATSMSGGYGKTSDYLQGKF